MQQDSSDCDSFFSKDSDEYQSWAFPANQNELIEQISNFIEVQQGKPQRSCFCYYNAIIFLLEVAVFTFMQNMKNIENSLEEATQNFHQKVFQTQNEETMKDLHEKNLNSFKRIQEHQAVFKQKFLSEIAQKQNKKQLQSCQQKQLQK